MDGVGPALVAVLERSRALGFLGPGPVERHIEQAAAFVAAVSSAPGRLLDLGSGGGVPGLVLAAAWPDAEVVLLDALAKRTTFLREVVVDLGWSDRVEVVVGRAEELGRHPAHRGRSELVVARSFGPPAVTAECGAPFLLVGGLLAVADPPDGAARWPTAGLATLGLTDEGSVATGSGTVRRLRAVVAVDDRYPRRVGIPTKRPLF